MTEDIHQQSIGTGAGVEFTPASPIGAGERMASQGMNFAQAPLPFSIFLDGAVACRKEISVLGVIVIRRKANGRVLPVAVAVRKFVRFSIGASSICEIQAKGGCKVHEMWFS